MATRRFLFAAADGYNEQGADADDIKLGGLVIGSGSVTAGAINLSSGGKIIGVNAATTDGDALVYGQSSANLAGLTIDTADLAMSNQKITGLAAGVAAGDAVNLQQLEQAVITGGTLKEALFSEDQLSDAEGFLGLTPMYFVANPVEDDYIEFTDGTTTRQYEFGTSLTTGDVLVAIGGTPAITMQNLVDAINGDGSAVWTAELNTNHDDINNPLVEVWEDDNDGGVSRVYGVWATQANIQYVDFTGELQYTKNATSNLPTADPTTSNFGIRRTQSALTDGELHYILGYDSIWGWDNDGTIWVPMSGSASIPDATAASGGGTKGKITVDSDYGLSVATGILSMNITADKGLQFNSGALEIEIASANELSADASGLAVEGVPTTFNIGATAVGVTVTAPNLDTLTNTSNADLLHAHAHSATTGQTANDHHNQSHVLTGGDHTESGLTSGHVLTATGATTFGWAAPSLADEARRIENDFIGVENVTKGDPVYWEATTADRFGKADAGTDAKKYVIGVAKADITSGVAGEIVSFGIAAGVLTGATQGTQYYLADGGGLTTSVPGSGKNVVRIGWAVNATDLWINPVVLYKAA